VAKKYNVLFNDEPCNTPSHQTKFCGVLLDLALKTADISKKQRERLQKIAEELKHVDHTTLFTMKDLMRLMGTLFFASRVKRHPAGEYYALLKLYSRRTARYGHLPYYKVTIWARALANMKAWIDCILEGPVRVPADDQGDPYILFTDASGEGFGAVLCTPDGRVLTFGGRWSETDIPQELIKNSNARESTAAAIACEHFLPVTKEAPIRLIVDNTSVKSSLVHGHSRVMAMCTLMKRHFSTVRTVEYLNTKLMPADSLSRALPLDEKILQEALEAVTDRPAPGALGWTFGAVRAARATPPHYKSG
jgi:hypothetical protein